MTQAVTATRMRQTAARTAKETKKGDSEAVETNAAASRSAKMERVRGIKSGFKRVHEKKICTGNAAGWDLKRYMLPVDVLKRDFIPQLAVGSIRTFAKYQICLHIFQSSSKENG